MKRAIKILVLLVASCLLFASCNNKTAINSIAISDTSWKLLKTVTSENGVEVNTWYPSTQGLTVTYEFDSDGEVMRNERGTTGLGTHMRGTWVIDDNKLIVSFTTGYHTYNIEKAGILELILSETYAQNGHTFVDVLTFQKE
ncbi:MAG: hypothetical protein J5669_08390 [Bacteroidales bacterium]|nr:hypothetical protein [Bacteroidales bacterium]